MRYPAKRKQETRERIINSARRLFNRRGFAEVTIDDIMKDAGLTRGGFYRYFDTKEQLYSHAIRQFLCIKVPERWQREHVDGCAKGRELARMIVHAYLSKEHLEDRAGSCPLIALPSDVARGGKVVKAAFRTVLNNMVDVFAANLPPEDAREAALSLTALCVGAMVVARAIDDATLGAEIRAAAHVQVMRATGWAQA